MSDPINGKTYPYLFDSTEIPFMRGWTESFGRVANNNQSEAGEDIETVVRRGKLKVSAQCNGLSSLVKTIQTFYDKDSFVLTRYDQLAETYTTHNVRMTAFSADKVYQSEVVNDTVNVWKISFTLEEF